MLRRLVVERILSACWACWARWVDVIKPLRGPLALCPLQLPYAVIGKKSASAKNSYVTNPYPTRPDRFITVGTLSHIRAGQLKGRY